MVQKNGFRTIIWVILLSTIFTLFLYKLIYRIPYAATWDQVDFALGVVRFDLLAMQPHFPGYPYFILGGMFLNKWMSNPAEALSVLNTILMFTSCLPIYFLGRRLFSSLQSVFLVLFVQSTSYVVVSTTLPISEGAALAVLWWFLWSVIFAMEKRSIASELLPYFLFSVLLGIRLSYIFFGVGLLFLWWACLQNKKYFKIVIGVIVAVFFQLIWVLGLIQSEGSLQGFLTLAFSFTNGHFTDWGGAITATNLSMFARLKAFLPENVLWTGLFFQTFAVCLLYAVILLVRLIDRKQKAKRLPLVIWYMIFMSVSYFLWVFFAQNPEKPRHVLPLISILSFLFFNFVCQGKKLEKVKVALIVCLLIVNLYQSLSLLMKQQVVLPATYQLASYLEKDTSNFLIYTWEEERVMDYLQVNYAYKKILSYPYFLNDLKLNPHKHIYITNRVLGGFKEQGIDVKDSIVPIATFRSSSILDPIYHHIELYEWIGER